MCLVGAHLDEVNCMGFEMVASSEVVSAGKDLTTVAGSSKVTRFDCTSQEAQVVAHQVLEWF